MSEAVRIIELKKIRPNRLNPRLDINVERLNELADSIREVGLLEPIIVRPADGEFEVVVGERRYRACQQAGLERIPAIIRDYSDDQVIQLNLIENVQREDLSAIEKGKVCKTLLEEYPEKYPSRVTLKERIGVSQDTISLWMRAVEVVPQEAQTYVASSTVSGEVPEGKIDYQTAVKVGRAVKEPEKRVEVIKKLAEKRLPVKERVQVIEKLAREPEKPVEEAIEEVTEAAYELHFRAAEMKPILNDAKTQTARTGVPDPRIKVGMVVHATVLEPHFAQLRVTGVLRKRLRYFDEEDAQREGYKTLEEFKKVWTGFHGGWDEGESVYVIRFERVK